MQRDAKNEDENLEKMKTKELKERLASLGLKTTGRKTELRARLREAMDGNDISSEEESDDESEDEDDKRNARGYKRGTRRVYQDCDEYCRRACVGSTLSFKDVEDALESFSGDKGENVERWFESFEEVADTCMWSDGQKTIYAKKLLKGSAKIFANFECHARTWHELKSERVKEFSKKVNSRQVHQRFRETKKKDDEACLAYMYRMLEIASHVNIEEEAKVEYIIDGIIDDESNKTILYDAMSIKELRKRLMTYEEQKSRRAKSIAKPAKIENSRKSSQSGDAMKKRRCFNCGGGEHLSTKCPEKGKGVKCFKCNEFGHIAAKCTARPKETYVILRPEEKKCMKEVSIDDCKFISVVDTGSDLTFIRSDEYARLGSPPVGKRKIKFDGFGSAGNETWDDFTKIMTVDGCEFPVTLHVVSNKLMSRHSLLLGTDFLDQVELRVKRGEVTFIRLDEQTDKDAPDIFKINIVEQAEEVDLSHVQEPYYRETIRGIIREYKPEKKRDADVIEKIVLKSDKPVVRRPRRLAPSEKKEVDGCDEIFVGCIEYRANCRVEQTRPSVSSKNRIKSENEVGTRKFEIVRRQRAINPTPCRRRAFNKRHKKATTYKTGDLVAIKRTQNGPGLKLHSEFLGPYRVVQVMRNDRYIVEKVGEHEGPKETSTTADVMMLWVINTKHDASDDSETKDNI